MLAMELGAMANEMGYMEYRILLNVSHVVILITLMIYRMYII
jgi:hypothetical protein